MNESISFRQICALVAVTALGLAPILTSGGAAQAAAAGGPVIVGTGYTDVSTLDVMGWEGAEPGKAPPPRHPEATPLARTDKIACGGRKDFYRVIEFGGRTTCFQRAGELNIRPTIYPVEYVCPGANAGAVWYKPGVGVGAYGWSTTRDGHSNWNACWRFDRPTTTTVAALRIR